MHNKLFYKKLTEWSDPELVFDTLFKEETDSFWLDSSLTNNDNRFSYMGAEPQEIYSYMLKQSSITIQTNKRTKLVTQDIFHFLETKLKKHTIISDKLPFPFIGGLVGYFGYELKELTGAKTQFQSLYPDSLWFLINKFIAFDHKEEHMYLVCLAKDKHEADVWFEVIEKKLISMRKNHNSHDAVSKKFAKNQDFIFARSRQQYLNDIETCKEYLRRGESYQICLTNTITAKRNTDPLTLYKILRNENPAPYAAYFRHNDLAVLCSSPEQFLTIDQNKNVRTKPIKGTIRRGHSIAEDKKLKQQLKNSKKDWSENAMIIDLLRNDLGKVCKFGSVKLTKRMAIESYQTVHQLVSTIEGKLRDEVSVIDCINACFPGGSMTGAPKLRTMEILESLEKKARGIYAGSLGFLSFNQTAALNIIIRTIITKNNELSIGTGGAILMDSVPQLEFDETLLKAKALLESIDKAVYTTPMHTVFLALGSNVGNKKHNIKQAVVALEKHLHEIKSAKLYETKPMYHEDQDLFINTVIKGQTQLLPQQLFAFVKNAERELGRQERFLNGPREIDIDILFYDQLVYESVNLIIPHPRISEREFVLKPFTDIDPEFVHPIFQKTIKELYIDLSKQGKDSNS
ncbi:MAG TPA: aminodeoxychorismate synthase component I [Candidatus Acidoferrales bacterium]|nr:aminodeoxychorismate synthase component I [Candidatus Acidoferrales bacterium]